MIPCDMGSQGEGIGELGEKDRGWQLRERERERGRERQREASPVPALQKDTCVGF